MDSNHIWSRYWIRREQKANRQFASFKNSHFQTEAKCKTFLAIMSFICMRIKLHFHINGFAPSFALKQRLGLLLWLGISVSRNCSTVGCQKCVPFILQWVSAPLNYIYHQLKQAIMWVPSHFKAKLFLVLSFWKETRTAALFLFLIFGIYLHSLFLCIAQSANFARNFDTFWKTQFSKYPL